MRTPEFIASWPEVPATTWDFSVASEVGAVLWDQALHLWDLTLTPGDSVNAELNCRTPRWCPESWLLV